MSEAQAVAESIAQARLQRPAIGVSPVERAAILLLALGETDAAKVLRHLDPREVQQVGSAIAELADVKPEQISAVLDAFGDAVNGQSGLTAGAPEYIRRMLVNALGEEKATALVDRILGVDTAGLDKLKWMDPRSVAELIQNEHPQIQAIIVSYLDPLQAADVVGLLPSNDSRVDVLMRVAALESVTPNALQELNLVLEEHLAGASASRFKNMGGSRVAAEIMNNVDSRVEEEMMSKIQELDEHLGEQIQDLMFIFDNLVDVDDRAIQTLLREVSTDNLVVALKGTESSLRDKIFKNMSKRAAELLQDDLEAKGPVRVSDVEAAQKEILMIARRLADAGEISLGGSGGEEMI